MAIPEGALAVTLWLVCTAISRPSWQATCGQAPAEVGNTTSRPNRTAVRGAIVGVIRGGVLGVILTATPKATEKAEQARPGEDHPQIKQIAQVTTRKAGASIHRLPSAASEAATKSYGTTDERRWTQIGPRPELKHRVDGGGT